MKQNLIAAVAALDFENYRAEPVHRAVRGLMDLSKAEALDEIENYLAAHTEAQHSIGLFILLRCLIEMPDGEAHPVVRLGQPSLNPPVETSALPRFPCLLAGDVPFLIVRGYNLGGLPERVADHVAVYRAQEVLRKSLAAYPGNWEEVEGDFQRQWLGAYGVEMPEEVAAMVKEQF